MSKNELPIITVDTREQKPYQFRKSARCGGYEIDTLKHGDYQIKGRPDIISIERKNGIDELCLNLGKNRVRFERELVKMQESRYRYVVIEDYWSSIFRKKYSRMSPNSIFGSIISFELKYDVHFMFAGNRKMAQAITKQLLLKAHQKVIREGNKEDGVNDNTAEI